MLSADERVLEKITSLIYRKFGLYIGKEKYERLDLKLENMKRREGWTGIEELCARLSTGDQVSFEQLACCVTTCHTFFFRESEHFYTLAADIRSTGQKETLIWCAACSSGEEPYSIAMSLLDSGITDFHIIASDINHDVLSEFNRGVYHESRLSLMPLALRTRYFLSMGDGYFRIDQSLRKYVSIKNLNLMDSGLFFCQVDYIFCRNVFIYFDENSREQALRNVVQNLKPHGLLFIGHAEVLLQSPANLKKVGNSVFCRTY
jgi:chemotaxis protein methyltransferase CheR